MIAPPTFPSPNEHAARLGDVEFWWPYLAAILKRHDLLDSHLDPLPGHNPTNPTFVYGDVVVKLFGYSPNQWRKSHAAEHAALRLIATEPEIAAPRLLGDGNLFDDRHTPWPYLITTRIPGIASWEAVLTDDQRRALAVNLGKQIGRIHALAPAGVATEEYWPAWDIVAAAERTSLPRHLVAQVEDYVARLGPPANVFINSDVVANHVYVEDGRFAGIIDWGDAMVTDQHVEIIQIYRDAFECDGSLLRVFLDASNWPVDSDFPQKAMGHALRRQAFGLVQHNTIDVFMPIAAKFPLWDISTLDELANVLFDV